MRLAFALAALLALALAAPAQARQALRDVVFVANAEGGTVSVVDARTLAVVREIDVVPDGRSATLGEDDPLHALAGQQLIEAAGGTNLAQDQDVSPDGRTLYVSRGHRGDVAAFDLESGRLLWKVSIPGLRADHMTISPDGARLYVSALTDNHVHVVDTRRRAITGTFATGQWPHDSHLSHDGARLYNASIGTIVAPEEARGLLGPPPYQLTVVDPVTLERLRAIEFERGIRPYEITHDERRMFAQLSLLHGVVEVALPGGEIVRRLELPVDAGVTEEDYDFEAPHHGLAMSPDERTLCLAGRASDYVALVSTERLEPEAIIDVGDAPGWAANGPDGSHCFVPNTREDTLSVISYAQRREVARLRVGDGPKQIEAASVPVEVVSRLTRRCAGGRLRAAVLGDEGIRTVDFVAGGRLLARDTAAPFARTLRPGRTRARRLHARLLLEDGTRATLTRSLPRCSR